MAKNYFERLLIHPTEKFTCATDIEVSEKIYNDILLGVSLSSNEKIKITLSSQSKPVPDIFGPPSICAKNTIG